MRIVVLDGYPIDQGQLDWDTVRASGELTLYPRTRPDEVLARAAGAEAVLTNKVLLGGETIGKLPGLRYVGILATGTNVVDFAACRARGIAVTNVPGYCAPSVAQFVMAMLLHFFEDVPSYVDAVRANAWAAQPDYALFLRPRVELAHKTMAILGMGSIGSKVADLARAFGMTVLAAAVPGGSTDDRVALAEAFATADVVSLHCPLTERTRKLVNRDFLQAMKPGAVLVNTARGALVDEGALLEALAAGRLGGALLDVVEEEPPRRDHPLFDARAPWAGRLLVTPHVSWGTVEARRRLIQIVGANLAAYLRGERQNRVD
ncbi:MAG TPA: D-2-hydroxyacid dehydrogenase [Polyangiaceae bacterium]|nr:D-2-hydroxyacid dehydrogenase [Polyangiaceae bacterium]